MIKKCLLAVCLSLLVQSGVIAQTVRYGYCPEQSEESNIVAQGTGNNKFVEGMICLDPQADPVMQRLKGHQIKGVRVYLRTDYKQASQKRSFVVVSKDSPEKKTATKYCNFQAGWNEILFDNPETIGEEKLFVGLQVYETIGSPLPLLSVKNIRVPGGNWVNLGREGWKDMADRGTLLIQAILDDEAAPAMNACVYTQLVEYPLTVQPEKKFQGTVYFLNHSDKEVSKVTLHTIGSGDDEADEQEVCFEPALQPYDGRLLNLDVRACKDLGTAVDLNLSISAVDGQEAQAARICATSLYTTNDAFLRIPLVEEFTSQRCPNCPYMMYYVERARKAYKGPLLYVTHHTGYLNDKFTLADEKQLEYLFGTQSPYNPAIMYDRTYLPEFGNVVMKASAVPSEQSYIDRFGEAALKPAMAEVLVDVNKEEKQISCSVYGRINQELAASDEPLYLTAYLVEDGLSLDKYPQMGLDVDDGPEDLTSSFSHNGIIRHSFTKTITGDVLTVNADATFRVDFPAAEWQSEWNWDKSQVIAFVHKYNEMDLMQNEVLNAGSNRYNQLINGIESVVGKGTDDFRIFATSDGKIHTTRPTSNLRVYNLKGVECASDSHLHPGIYVVRAVDKQGVLTVGKVVVK